MIHVTLHQLRVFKKVAQTKSVTKAAHLLHMTQPAVSNIIRNIEQQIDSPIIEVLHKKLHITPTGEILLNAYEHIERQLEEAKTKINLMKGKMVGTIRIASVSTAKYFIPRLLGAFKTLYPEINIELKIKNRQEIIERLDQNLDDFVIMSQLPELMAIEHQDFYEDELVVAASNLHPLAHQKRFHLKVIANEPWLIREVGSGTRMAMENILNKYKVKPNIQMEIDNNESIKQAIIGNIGISILSHQSIDIEQKAGLIKVLDVIEFPIKHKWFLVKSKGKQLSTFANGFYDFVRKHPNLGSFRSSVG